MEARGRSFAGKSFDVKLIGHIIKFKLLFLSLPFLSASGSSNIFDLTVDEHFIYWSDWKNMVIWKTAKKQQHQQQPSCQMEPVKRLNSRPMGISAAQIPPANEDCLDLDVEHEFKPAPAAVSLQMTKQQNEEDANPVGKEDPCLNYCLNGAKCTVTSSDIAVCLCDPGFSGQRCQLDQCQNYCLNGGLCSRVVASAEDEQFPSLPGLPSCQCGPGFSGHRCQRQSDLEQRQLPFILAIVFLSVFLVFSCCVILCISIRNRKSQEDSGKIRSPQIVRKRSTSRSFSGNRESSKSAAGKLNSAAFREACGGDRQTSENASCGGSGGSGVVIDLEDCCKMTLCDTVRDIAND